MIAFQTLLLHIKDRHLLHCIPLLYTTDTHLLIEFHTDSLIEFHICIISQKANREKLIFNQYSKPWKKQDLADKKREKGRKTWHMLLMRFNQVLMTFNRNLVGFKQENFSVWQNYCKTKKSCDKPRLSMLKHWQAYIKPRITKNSWCKLRLRQY